jgi:YidC/Oxa1 family membrane protein insertase
MVDPLWLAHVANGLADAAAAPPDAVAAAAAGADTGPFPTFVNFIESAIKACDGVLMQATGQKSFGISIVLFTLVLKGLTYPLTKAQLTSTTKMQAIQPKVKEIQAKFQTNPEVMQREMQLLYTENEVNPLAGCLPALVQIPVFIGLYRALLKLATDDLLNEPFLWLPNLEGPVYGAQNADWLFKNWEGTTPPLGWHDTLCYLTLPLILIVVQSISQKLITPQQDPETMDESQAASQQIIQYLPIMFGFFALNVPSGLGIYWVTNTLFSTAATVLIRKQVETEMEAAGLSVAPAAVASPGPSTSSSPTSFSDMIEGPPSISADSTFTPLDAEVVDSGLVDDLSVQGFGSAADGGGTPASSKPKKAKKSKKKKGKK